MRPTAAARHKPSEVVVHMVCEEDVKGKGEETFLSDIFITMRTSEERKNEVECTLTETLGLQTYLALYQKEHQLVARSTRLVPKGGEGPRVYLTSYQSAGKRRGSEVEGNK